MLHMQLPVSQFHAVGDGAPAGTFRAIVTTFGIPVRAGYYTPRILMPGCADRTLRERGYPSCVWAHDWDTPPIAVTNTCVAEATGLTVEARLFVAENETSPRAREVYTAMNAVNGDGKPALREFSIGFDIVAAGWEIRDEEEFLAITDMELYEYGPCLVGRNVSQLLEANGHPTSDPAEAEAELLKRFPKKNTRGRHSAAARELLTQFPRH